MIQIGQQLVRNIFSSWFGYFIRITITFFFVPYLTSVLGDARYGVWVIVFQTMFYFSLFDLSLSTSLNRFIPKFLRRNETGQIRKVLSSATALYGLVGSLAFLGIYIFATWFFDYFQIGDPEMIAEGKAALLIMGIYLTTSFYLLPYGNSLGAFQRYDIVNLLNIAEELVRVTIMVLLLRAGHGLSALAMTILATSVLKHLIGIIILRRLHPKVGFSRKCIDKDTTRLLLGYSRISFGIAIGWLIIFNTDSILLGLMISSAAAGVYHPGAQLWHHARNLINAIGTPLIPAIAHIDFENDSKKIGAIYLRGLKYTSYISFFIGTSVFLYARPFVNLWLPAEFGAAADAMRVLALGAVFFLPQIIGNAVLYGMEKHSVILKTVAVESLLKIALALFLVQPFGIVGMAAASAIPQILVYTTIYPTMIGRATGVGGFKQIASLLVYGSAAVAITTTAHLIIGRFVLVESWSSLVLTVSIISVIILAVGYFILEPIDRQRISQALSFRKS